MMANNDIKNLGDLLDPEKTKDFDYLFVTDSDSNIQIVHKHDLI